MKISKEQQKAADDLARVHRGKQEAARSGETGNDIADANLRIAKTQERWVDKPR